MCITSISICLWLISAFCLLFSPPALEMRKCTLWYLQMCTCINICDICRCASVWIPVHPCASASMPPCCYERLGGPLGVQLPQTEGFPQPHHQFNEQRCFLVLLCSLKYMKIYCWVNFVYCHDLPSVFYAFCKSCQQEQCPRWCWYQQTPQSRSMYNIINYTHKCCGWLDEVNEKEGVKPALSFYSQATDWVSPNLSSDSWVQIFPQPPFPINPHFIAFMSWSHSLLLQRFSKWCILS